MRLQAAVRRRMLEQHRDISDDAAENRAEVSGETPPLQGDETACDRCWASGSLPPRCIWRKQSEILATWDWVTSLWSEWPTQLRPTPSWRYRCLNSASLGGGDLSCLDENRPGKPLTILGPPKRHQVQSRLFHWYGASQSIQRKETNCKAQGSAEFSVHMDNSVCHNDARPLKNLRTDTLRELLAHLIHQAQPVWLLVIWDLETEDEGASFSEWRINFGRYHRELEWTHIRGHPESFPSLDGTPNMRDCQHRRILLIINGWDYH
jgi:hypothetical protein